MKKVFTYLFLISFFLGNAQSYRVYFKDKGFHKTEITAKDVSLSKKALENRKLRNIELDYSDLAVSKDYLKELQEKGARVNAISRWFNYALVEGLDAEALLAFDFVKRIESPKKYQVEFAHIDATNKTSNVASLNYGMATTQIEMIRGQILHDFNLQGQGMTIAVLDGGFFGTDSGPAFDSLWMNNQILGTKSFVSAHPTIYEDGSHGTKVLSILGGYIDGQLIGSAPKANYWLLKSEKESTEFPVEMDNWMMAAEFADSVGADIITSSLGYNEFQGGNGDYVYNDMDGNTTVVTKAADMAAKKGILVIVSAGNEGTSPWQHITAPADGDSVMAVGSVTNLENRSSFSSKGPTADGRIKPNVMAMGQATAFSNGTFASIGNGTSFSFPVISGMAACLWQSNSSKSNMEIFNIIESSSSQANSPDNNYGNGIPNFEVALYNTIGLEDQLTERLVSVYPNPVVQDEIRVSLGTRYINMNARIYLHDIGGRNLLTQDIDISEGEFVLDFPYSEGVYILNIQMGKYSFTQKILK